MKKEKEGKGRIRERGIERESPEAISFLEGIALRGEAVGGDFEREKRGCESLVHR